MLMADMEARAPPLNAVDDVSVVFEAGMARFAMAFRMASVTVDVFSVARSQFVA